MLFVKARMLHKSMNADKKCKLSCIDYLKAIYILKFIYLAISSVQKLMIIWVDAQPKAKNMHRHIHTHLYTCKHMQVHVCR